MFQAKRLFLMCAAIAGAGTGCIGHRSACEPGDPASAGNGSVRVAVVLPDTHEVHVFGIMRASSGEAVLLDYDFGDAAPRQTPLGYAALLGATKASFVGVADGTVRAAFPTSEGIRLVDLGDLRTGGPLHPRLLGTLPASEALQPG